MSGIETVYWMSVALMWLVIIPSSVVTTLRARRLRAISARLEEAAQESSALEAWARRTVFSVTDRTGLIYSGSLAQIYREQADEDLNKVWTAPVAVSLWSYADTSDIDADLAEETSG